MGTVELKLKVEARLWYPLRELGDLKDNIEKAIKTYLALLNGTLVLKYNDEYYELVDVEKLKFKDAAGCTFKPLCGEFSRKAIKKFVDLVAPYVIKPGDGRPYKINIRVKRRNATFTEDYCYDYLYPDVIAKHVLHDEPVTMEFYREDEDIADLIGSTKFVFFEKDNILVGVPKDFDVECVHIAQKPELPEVSEDRSELSVYFGVDKDLWDIFVGLIKWEGKTVSETFNEALKLYLGGIWNTLVVKEYYCITYYPELKREVVNAVYEDFKFEDTKYRPVGGERENFTEQAVRAMVRNLGKPYAYMDSFRPFKYKKANGLSEDEIVNLIFDDYIMIYKKDRVQLMLGKNKLHIAYLDGLSV